MTSESSILDLITGQTFTEAKSFKATIRQVVQDRGCHSLFVSLVRAHLGSMPSISEEEIDENNSGDQELERSLLHLTPLKDINVRVLCAFEIAWS